MPPGPVNIVNVVNFEEQKEMTPGRTRMAPGAPPSPARAKATYR